LYITQYKIFQDNQILLFGEILLRRTQLWKLWHNNVRKRGWYLENLLYVTSALIACHYRYAVITIGATVIVIVSAVISAVNTDFFFAKDSLARIYASLCERPGGSFTKTSPRLTNRFILQMRFDCERKARPLLIVSSLN